MQKTYFVYGTLVDQRVQLRVTGKMWNPERFATLKGYKKIGLNIVEDEGSEVQGVLITPDDLQEALLDHYEGIEVSLYHKINVTVTEANGSITEAISYQLTDETVKVTNPFNFND